MKKIRLTSTQNRYSTRVIIGQTSTILPIAIPISKWSKCNL